MIALDLALQRPELFRALVLLDPAVNLKHCLTPRLVARMSAAKLLNRIGRPRRGAEVWMRYVSSHPSGESSFDRVPMERREALRGAAGGIFADAGAGLGDVPEDRLGRIEIPTTIVDCSLSPPFLRRSCRRLRELMPQASTVTLEQSGHYVGFDARDELIALLRDVVARSAQAPVP